MIITHVSPVPGCTTLQATWCVPCCGGQRRCDTVSQLAYNTTANLVRSIFTILQEFTADMTSRPVKRIEDVMTLRAAQFSEDAGPLAHPVSTIGVFTVCIWHCVRFLCHDDTGPLAHPVSCGTRHPKCFAGSVFVPSGRHARSARHYRSTLAVSKPCVAGSWAVCTEPFVLSRSFRRPAAAGPPRFVHQDGQLLYRDCVRKGCRDCAPVRHPAGQAGLPQGCVPIGSRIIQISLK